jgi:hypothetical protein
MDMQPQSIWAEPYPPPRGGESATAAAAAAEEDPGDYARWCRGDTALMLSNHTAQKISDAASCMATVAPDEPFIKCPPHSKRAKRQLYSYVRLD